MTAAAAGGRRLTADSSVVPVLEHQCHKNSQCGQSIRTYSSALLRDIQYTVHTQLPPANGYRGGHVQGGTLYGQEKSLILCPSSSNRDSSTNTTNSCSTTQGPQHVGTTSTTTRQASCCKYSTGGHSDWVGTTDSALLPNIHHPQHPGGTTRPQPPSLVPHGIPMDPGPGRTACTLPSISTNVANVNTNVASTSGVGAATPTTVGKQCRSSSGCFSRRSLTLLQFYLAMLLTLLPTMQVAADCSPLPSISHGNITYYQDPPNSTLQAQVSCDLNYRPTGSDVIMCLPSGSWNDTIPSCELVLCESLPTIPNGEVLHAGRQVGSTANYTCIKGFRMMGSAERTCLHNATWTGTQPQCRRIVCKHPGTPVYGTADPPDDTDYPAGTTITYSCHLGYNINGSSSTVCSESGSWTKPVPYCSVMDCGTPPVLLHATPVYDSTLLWENVTYTCDVGYTSVDNTSLVCAVNASWTGQVYACTELPPQSTTDIMTTTGDVTTTSTHTMSPTSPTSVKTITDSPSPQSSSSSPTTATSITTPSTSSAESTEQASSSSTARALPESTTYLVTKATSKTTEQEVTSLTPEITTSETTARIMTSDAGDVMTMTSARDISTPDVSTVPVTSSTTSQGLSSSAAATLMVPTTLQTSSSGATSIATTKSEMSGEKLAIIIGIVIGSVLPVVLIAGLCFLCRRKRNRGAYEVRYNVSPKEESTIMIESSKPEVYGNGHVMGNGHDNHVTLWCDESPIAQIPDISNPNNRQAPQNNHSSNGSSKDRGQGTSQNNHSSHGNTRAHAPYNHGNHSNPRDLAQRNPKHNHSSRSNTKEHIQGDTVLVCMTPDRPDTKLDDPGGSSTVGGTQVHRGLNGNTRVTNNNPNKTSKLTHKTAL